MKNSTNARRKALPGPNKKEFSREQWNNELSRDGLEPHVRKLLGTGLLFDDLLSSIRADKRWRQLGLRPAQIMRALLAIATLEYEQLRARSISQVLQASGDGVLRGVFEMLVEESGRQEFSLDEIVTGLGDGLKHILRELIMEKKDSVLWLPEPLLTQNDIEQIARELGTAVSYNTACEYWNECEVGAYACDQDGERSIVLRPVDHRREMVRMASIYRRLNSGLQQSMSLAAKFKDLSLLQKMRVSGMPLVSKVYGRNRIERVKLSVDEETLDDGMLASIAAKMVESGCYGELLDVALPKFGKVTLRELIRAWRLLESLARAAFVHATAEGLDDIAAFEQGGPSMSRRLLVDLIAAALRVNEKQARDILAVFVFCGAGEQELWTQPLVRIEDAYYFVFPCILGVHLVRIAEGWMRQGGFKLDVRGDIFERFCRKEIAACCEEYDKGKIFKLLGNALKVKIDGANTDIDIVLVVGSAVLLIEAKCILWPEDALQFANYFDKVCGAAIQATKRAAWARANYSLFSERMARNGISLPSECPELVPCVLVNSPVYAGFRSDGVAVIDLPILLAYIQNSYMKIRTGEGGMSGPGVSLSFYDNADDAGKRLAAYLEHPPQMADMLDSTKERQTYFRYPEQDGFQLTHRFYQVEMDLGELKRKYIGENELETTVTVRYCPHGSAS